MKKQWISFVIIGVIGIVLIAALAFLFPETAREHTIAFILAAFLIATICCCMALLNTYQRERQRLQKAEHENEIHKLNTQIEIALRGIGGGFVIVKDDAEKTFVHVSESLAALLGYTVEEFLEYSHNKTSGIVTEEDFRAVFARNFSAQEEDGDILRFHVRCKDGSLKWISSKGKIMLDENGERVRYSFNHDITQLEESRIELEETANILAWERALYRDAMIHGCDYAYVLNASTNKIHDVYQEGFLAKYGFCLEGNYDDIMKKIAGQMKPMILHGMHEFHLCQYYENAYQMGERVLEIEYYVPDMNRYKRENLFLSQNAKGMVFVFVVAHDITKKKEAELEIERSLMQLADVAESVGSGNLDVEIDVDVPGPVGVLADTLQQMTLNLKWHMENLNLQALKDPLTGVKNKRAWNNIQIRLNEEMESQTADFAVVICDVNGLKQVNDNLGHEAGDALLLKACQHICWIFAHSPVYRIGGDEFGIILEGPDLENCCQLLDEFYRTMEVKQKSDKENLPISIALGVTKNQPEDHNFSDVFCRADAMMYQNKMAMKQGKQVIHDICEESGEKFNGKSET